MLCLLLDARIFVIVVVVIVIIIIIFVMINMNALLLRSVKGIVGTCGPGEGASCVEVCGVDVGGGRVCVERGFCVGLGRRVGLRSRVGVLWVVGGGNLGLWWRRGSGVIMSGPSRVQGQGFGESGVGRVGGVGGGKVVLLLSRDLVLVGLL